MSNNRFITVLLKCGQMWSNVVKCGKCGHAGEMYTSAACSGRGVQTAKRAPEGPSRAWSGWSVQLGRHRTVPGLVIYSKSYMGWALADMCLVSARMCLVSARMCLVS